MGCNIEARTTRPLDQTTGRQRPEVRYFTGSQSAPSDYTCRMDLTAFPGGDLAQEGLADLARGEDTIPALLVSIGALRLRRLGLPVAEATVSAPECRLYDRLAESDQDSAHSRYNALVRRLVSFENTAECVGL